MPDGTSQQMVLRRSVTVWVATAACILITAFAVHATAAPRLGTIPGVVSACAALAGLAVAAARRWRREPATIKIGSDGMTVLSRTGAELISGSVVGCSQWSNRLLILALAGPDRRFYPLLIAADALPDTAFRALAVLGRSGARASL